ncbi:class I mannose-6-phosphate isomerase [Kibdelosporangium phytohabitans]|uniref:Phosphohexomutase n=1 Tax=Kibdelosporangium phytohabitans TaxID=860235 RepID=A0A0N9IA39_9PSEU|nr:class I mannose-6-phosphate isomerase [Kibdelosporangium phytohabitans]ALG13241.1 mannose-6-phosphate isomerase [Kibdelosporangium phytohabitans]MBE1465011.1 mannose-6-phosphate isomerase [Kibdelosporangium phytohabitans]
MNSPDVAVGSSPVWLPANQPTQFYAGGDSIQALRGVGNARTDHGPEDWVGSTTTRYGKETDGLTKLADGQWLRDAVRAHPENWLGKAHAARFGGDPAVLVKLLDAGQRLPVHCHPSDAFAQKHMGSHFGKTEAWIIVGTPADGGDVHIGFRGDESGATVAEWVAEQDTAAMLEALNPVTVRPGDTVFVPAGLPHAIGAGVFIVELQQPTDLSVTLEWKDFLDSEAGGHLGFGYDVVLDCVDRTGWDADRLKRIVRHTEDSSPVTDLLGPDAASFFRAQRVRGGAALDPSFSIVVALDGSGTIKTESGDVPVTKGDTYVLPHAAGEATVEGDIVAIRCLPPAVTE